MQKNTVILCVCKKEMPMLRNVWGNDVEGKTGQILERIIPEEFFLISCSQHQRYVHWLSQWMGIKAKSLTKSATVVEWTAQCLVNFPPESESKCMRLKISEDSQAASSDHSHDLCCGLWHHWYQLTTRFACNRRGTNVITATCPG